ncbi:hypothetical protein AB0B88_28565, partial [Micromonospora haikouensis]
WRHRQRSDPAREYALFFFFNGVGMGIAACVRRRPGLRRPGHPARRRGYGARAGPAAAPAHPARRTSPSPTW